MLRTLTPAPLPKGEGDTMSLNVSHVKDAALEWSGLGAVAVPFPDLP